VQDGRKRRENKPLNLSMRLSCYSVHLHANPTNLTDFVDVFVDMSLLRKASPGRLACVAESKHDGEEKSE
jgi:hypothetical protein